MEDIIRRQMPTIERCNGMALSRLNIKTLDKYLDKAFHASITVPRFYCLAKIHKPVLAGRPIAGATNWITTPLSKTLSHVLKPFVAALPHVYVTRNSSLLNVEVIS